MDYVSKFTGWLKKQWAYVKSNWRNTDDPMALGLAWSKAFATLLLLLAFIPYSSGGAGWELKIWTLFKSRPNEIGDTFAGIAGALAFLWIIVTVQLQSRELKAQREELALAREEYAKMASSQADQSKVLSEQAIDNLVLEMMSSFNSIVSSIDITGRSKKGAYALKPTLYSGRDCFRFFYGKVFERDHGDNMYGGGRDLDSTLERYQDMYEKHSSDLGHYFRFVHNMLRVVDEHPAAVGRHKKLIRALFSDDELLTIFYNALTPRGQPMQKYIESFELFDNLPTERLVQVDHRNEFNPKCFGDAQ